MTEKRRKEKKKGKKKIKKFLIPSSPFPPPPSRFQFVSRLCVAINHPHSVLSKLVLSSNLLTSHSASHLSSTLSASSSLTELRLASNPIGDSGFTALIRALMNPDGSGSKRLKILDVEECGLGDDSAEALGSMLVSSRNVELEDVYLGRNKITAVGAKALSRGYSTAKKVQHVRLGGCPIGDEGVTVICRAISNAKHIRSVWFGACDLTPKCAPALQNLLSTGWDGNKQLEEVWLGGNDIREEGAIALATSLKWTAAPNSPTNNKLQRIYVGNNNISSQGCLELANAVASNPYLISCGLIGNPGLSDNVRSSLEANQKRNMAIAQASKKEGISVEAVFASNKW